MRKHFTPAQAAEAAEKIKKGTAHYTFDRQPPTSGSSWAVRRALRDALHMEAACEVRTMVLNEFEWCGEEGIEREVIFNTFVRALTLHVDDEATHQGRCAMVSLIQGILY